MQGIRTDSFVTNAGQEFIITNCIGLNWESVKNWGNYCI